MDEIRARVVRIFEAHLPTDENNELHPNFVTNDREGIERLRETIDGFVVGRLKNWYIEEGTNHPWIIKVIQLLRGFVIQFKASSNSYDIVYGSFLKVREQCWKIIHEDK